MAEIDNEMAAGKPKGTWRILLPSAVAGGCLTGALAVVVQSIAFGWSDISASTIVPPMIVGVLGGASIAFLFLRNRNLLLEQLRNEMRASDRLVQEMEERNRAVEAALLSKKKFEDFANAASDWYWETDAELRYVDFSDKYENMTGYDKSRWAGMTRQEVLEHLMSDEDREDREKWRTHFDDLENHRPFRALTYGRILSDGSTAYTQSSGTPVFDINGIFLGYRGAASDVTEKVETEKALAKFSVSLEAEVELREQAESVLQDSIDSVSEAFILYDENDNFVTSNDKMFEIFPWVKGKCVPGTSLLRMLELGADASMYPEAFGRREDWIQQRLREHRDFETDHLRLLADGRWIQARNRPTRNGGVVGVRTDVTELVNAVEMAETANRAKSDFLANMSHELRTPLNAVIGYAQLIKLEPYGNLGNARYGEYVDDIHESGKHLLAIIDDILDLSRIEAGKMAIQSEIVDLGEIVDTCIRFMSSKAFEKNITVTTAPRESWPKLNADPRFVRQALLNLLSNSVKFSANDSKIEISNQSLDDGKMAIVVADTGIGMAPQEIEIAMEQFGQVDTSLTRENEGTGLGLPLVKSLMELHGGGLVIESEKGVGTRARLVFPEDRIVRGKMSAVSEKA